MRAAFAGCPRSTWRPTAAPRSRHHARRHLPRLRHPHRRPCSPASSSSAPRSWAPGSWAPRSLAGTSLVGSSLVGTSLVAAAPRSAVPRPESLRAPVGQTTRPTAAHGQAACVPHGRVRARRPWVARMSGRTHGTPGPARDPVQRIPWLCAIPAAYLVFLSLFRVPMSGIVGIARAIPAIPDMSVSRNSSNSELKYSGSYSCH